MFSKHYISIYIYSGKLEWLGWHPRWWDCHVVSSRWENGVALATDQWTTMKDTGWQKKKTKNPNKTKTKNEQTPKQKSPTPFPRPPKILTTATISVSSPEQTLSWVSALYGSRKTWPGGISSSDCDLQSGCGTGERTSPLWALITGGHSRSFCSGLRVLSRLLTYQL